MSYPNDYYWGPISGQFFGSLTSTEVPASNAAYLAWLAKGNTATVASSINAVRDVLASYRIWTISLPALFTSIDALSTIQKNLISANLLGSPPLVLTPLGPNYQAIVATYIAIQSGILPTGALKSYLAALYCQDNPNYLVNPSFDVTINIKGTTF